MAGKVRAGEAYVSLFADPKALYAGLKAATKRVADFTKETGQLIRGGGLMGLGATMATIGAGIKAAFNFASVGDSLAKMSTRLHTNTEFLSEMGHVAKMTGADLGTMESALSSMQSNALAGDDTFARLGLDTRVLSFQPVEKQFDMVIDRLGGIRNEAILAAMATKIFGGAGSALLPMLKEGSAGIAAMRQEARDLGVAMSGEQAQAAVEMTSAWNRVKQALSGAATTLGSALAPALTEIFNKIAPVVSGVTDWIKDNKELIVTIAKWSAVLAGVSGAAVLLGTGLVGISTVLGGIGSILGVVATAAGLVGSVFAFLLSPIGLLTAGVVGLGTYFLSTSESVANATSWLISSFKDLFSFGTKTFQGIADAIAVGDLGLAMEVAWSAVKIVWVKGTNWLLDKWYAVKYGLLEVWSSVTHGIASAFVDATAGIQKAWVTLVAGLKSAWSEYGNWWQKTMNQIVGKAMGADQAYIDSMNRADDARHAANINAIDSDLQNQAAEIEANRAGTQAILSEDKDRDTNARTADHAAALTDMTNAENDALEKWKEATNKAAIKRREFQDLQRESGGLDPKKIFDGLSISAPGGGSSRGTFNAFEVGSMGNNVQDKQLQELVAIRRATEATQNVAAVGR